jgi:hypothetical protein
MLVKAGIEPVNVKNIRVNGELRGCSGFCQLFGDNRLIYFNTEHCVLDSLRDKVMFRAARSQADYSGGRNNWADFDNWAEEIAAWAKRQPADPDGMVGPYGGWMKSEFPF